MLSCRVIVDLSLYDTHRKPHEVVTDNSVIGVSPRALHSELMCPICLDLMKNTLTTKEVSDMPPPGVSCWCSVSTGSVKSASSLRCAAGRLTNWCAIIAVRCRSNKECPTCRKKLVSKRSLRPDPNFDALIAKVVALCSQLIVTSDDV